jgi:molybdate-binding protein
MAQQWGCTPGTVSRAYALLSAEGLISSHRGGGTRVAENPLPGQRPFLQWAALINRAEQFLLEALGQGHTPTQIQAALSVALGRWQALQETPRPQANSNPAMQLRFAGSHDLTVDLLARQLHLHMPDARLNVRYTGSLGGLMALARGEADIAGTHLWDEATDSYNQPFVSHLLPGQRIALVTLAHRSLGLMVPPGNPLGVQGLADLAHPNVQCMNRQRGSGTRVWLDAQLRALAIDPAQINGFAREEATHLGVAQAIAEGSANAGVGIHAAAAACGLGFVPLTQEVYQLVLTEMVWETAVFQTLLSIIQSAPFKEAVAALGGYDTVATGEITWI